MKWKDTEKDVQYLNINNYYYYKNNNRNGDPFSKRFWLSGFDLNGYIYPKKDLTSVENFETKTLQADTRLFFDQSSSFPRFKLTVSGNKRCIKQAKADVIVVSGNTDYNHPDNNYVVLEDDAGVYLINEDEWNTWFNGSLKDFIAAMSSCKTFGSNLCLAYQGRVNTYSKDNVYLAKYADGTYTLPYITDNNLDEIICGMCPEPTYEEVISLVDMLNSEDSAVVALGVKMLTGFNVAKYKLTFRLILYTRSNWYAYTRNTVGTKQLVDTLNLNTYYITEGFGYNCSYIERSNETYSVEDVALAKKVSSKLIREWLQKTFSNAFANNRYKWLPDERKVTLE